MFLLCLVFFSPAKTSEMEKLIELVRDHPLLYDPTVADYRDAIKVSNAWDSISRILDVVGMNGKYKI